MADDCIFCKIVRGEASCFKIYEDENFLGFLDIFPRVRGHSLLIPKKHYRWVWDVPDFGCYWEAAKKVSLALKKITGCESVNFLTLGEEVPHAHIWILPRAKKSEEVIKLGKTIVQSKNDMEKLAKQLFQEIRK